MKIIFTFFFIDFVQAKIALSNFFSHAMFQVAMGKRLGIEEPQLMRIMRATLHTHTEWFKLQMCKDRFEQLLNIDHLKEVDQFPKRLTDSWSRSLVDDSANNGSSQITTCSSGKVPEEGTSPPVALTGEAACDESAILKVMVSFVVL